MAVIEYDAYKQKLLALEPTLKELEQALNIEPARKELAELQIETEQEGFLERCGAQPADRPKDQAPGE